MFAHSDTATWRRQRRVLAASLSVHGLLLTWLLHSPEPRLLIANSVALGQNGRSLTRLYWPVQSPDNSTTSSSKSATEIYRHQRLGHQKLIWNPHSEPEKLALSRTLTKSGAEDSSKTTTLSNLGHGAPAGLRYGTLGKGPLFGDEIRPALPVATSDPVVYPWQLPATPGNEVIEITIDERGEIVRKVVLQSLGPEIDSKCLAALENWRFHPATQNGIPIPSKQDAIFPFKARG
jgi:Gram-negative bacterial TonB protein C-terminal